MPKSPKPDSPAPLVIEFASAAARRHFAAWLCGVGEQDYWEWMRVRQEREDGPITAVEFHYHGPEDVTKATSDPRRYGPFLGDGTIRTTCGRLPQEYDDDPEDAE